jgi:hypothetical protein
MAEEAFPLVSIALYPLQGGCSGQVHALVVIADALTLPLHPQGDRHTLDGVLFGVMFQMWIEMEEGIS